jgi:hypothetical protein
MSEIVLEIKSLTRRFGAFEASFVVPKKLSFYPFLLPSRHSRTTLARRLGG